MLKRQWARGLSILLAAWAMVGCRDDTRGTGTDLSDFTGTYTATRFEFTSVALPFTRIDLVADSGASLDLTIAADGQYALTGHFPGFPDEADTGTITIGGREITLHGIDSVTGTFTLSGSTLTISIPSRSAGFDFDNDGTDDPATARVVFQRR